MTKEDSRLHADTAEALSSDPRLDASRIAIAVKRVAGAKAIANDLVIELPSEHFRDDTDIARIAAEVLAWHSDLPESVVKHLSGVKGVVNELTINATPRVEGVRERIRRELERGVDRETTRVTIETKDARVVLKGAVNSLAELDAAERAAWSVPGVTEVQNDLLVV